MGREFLAHAPSRGIAGPIDLVGWKGMIEVCSVCAGRIMARGCSMQELATEPVWDPCVVSCDLCSKENVGE